MHLAEVPFDSICNVAPSLRDEEEQALQLLDPVLQRLGLPRLERLPGPLYNQQFSGHLK